MSWGGVHQCELTGSMSHTGGKFITHTPEVKHQPGMNSSTFSQFNKKTEAHAELLSQSRNDDDNDLIDFVETFAASL